METEQNGSESLFRRLARIDRELTGRTTVSKPSGDREKYSLVSAAKRMSGQRVRKTTTRAWQDEAWAMYDEIGELRFVANTLASAASRTRLLAAKINEDGDGTGIPEYLDQYEKTVTDEVAAHTMNLLGQNSLKRAELLRRLVIQLFVAGDGYIVGMPPGVLDQIGDDFGSGWADLDMMSISQLEWHALSINEVQFIGDNVILKLGKDQSVTVHESSLFIIRVWRPHPMRWWEADSPVRPNLPVLRELLGLTKHVSANIDSRLAGAGVLVMGNSVEVAQAAMDDGSPAPPMEFMDALMEAMTAPLEDRDSAASIVPLTIKVPDDVVDKIRHITFSTPFDGQTQSLRDEAIRRLALGLDAPPEVLLGMGAVNHWSAWQIDEATAAVHIAPVVALVCDALTTEFLWPVMEAAGIPPDLYKKYVVWYDLVDLTLRPNRSADAKELFDKGELSAMALRRETGFEDADADIHDLATNAVIQLSKTNPDLLSDAQGVARILDLYEKLYDGITAEELRRQAEVDAILNEADEPAPEPEPEPETEPEDNRELPDEPDQPPAETEQPEV